MRGTGKKIFNMALEKRFGQTIQNMRENIVKGKNMVKVITSGQMALNITETGLKIRLKDMEHIHGSMEDNTLGHGKITTCMAMELIPGRMEESMKATMNKIKNMVTEYTNGLMEEDMKEIGLMESNTVKENTYCQINLLE